MKYYQIPKARKEQIQKLADSKCWKCKGTGLGKWKSGGARVELCTCVQKALPEVQANLEEKKAALEKLVKRKATRRKVLTVAVALLVLSATYLAAFYLGTKWGAL